MNYKPTVYLIIALAGGASSQIVKRNALPRTLCQVLDSARDHQEVIVQGYIAGSHRHGFGLSEGINGDPCPGSTPWPFTMPSVVPIEFSSSHGVHLTAEQEKSTSDFLNQLRDLSVKQQLGGVVVTLTAVFVKKPWTFIRRKADGTYFGTGMGPEGAYPAVLVMEKVDVTSPLERDRSTVTA